MKQIFSIVLGVLLLTSCDFSSPVSQEPQDKQLYMGYCASCHGKEIDKPYGVSANLMYSALDPFEMEEVIKNGVDGTSMLAFENRLSDKEVKLIVSYIDNLRRQP